MDSKLDIRPVGDRVKQSMFEILKYDISGAKVLDLFAGTGSLGFEALSRGAREVVFVENNPRCIKLISENAKRLGFSGICKIVNGDVNLIIKKLYEDKNTFDIIMMDPPYLKDLVKISLQNLADNVIISHKGIVVVKHHKKEEICTELKIEIFKERSYGDTRLSFLRKVNKLRSKRFIRGVLTPLRTDI